MKSLRRYVITALLALLVMGAPALSHARTQVSVSISLAGAAGAFFWYVSYGTQISFKDGRQSSPFPLVIEPSAALPGDRMEEKEAMKLYLPLYSVRF